MHEMEFDELSKNVIGYAEVHKPTYMKLSNVKTGLIINFNNIYLKGKNAICRFVL
jgi:hypothetical protein